MDGCILGEADGSRDAVGMADGVKLGTALGLLLGVFEGSIVGKGDGCFDIDGWSLGTAEGTALGTELGKEDRVLLGKKDGFKLGFDDTVGGQPNAVLSGASPILLPDAIISSSTVRV